MNLLKNKALRKGALYTTVFGISLAATFLIAKNVSKPTSTKRVENQNTTPVNVETKPGERLLNSLLNYKALDFNADINIKLEDNTVIDLGLNGQGKINDIENIELLADLSANLDGARIDGQLGYFGDELVFSVDGICDFRLETEEITSFINMIPKYGISIDLPESLSTLSVDSIMDAINAIEDEDKKTTPQGNYYYNISFGNNEAEEDKAFNVMVLTDENDSFKGLRIDTFYFKGTKFSLSASLNEIGEDQYKVVNPLNNPETAAKYQNFAPVFTLVDCFYDLVKQDEIGADITLKLENKNQETSEYEERMVANLGLDMDIKNKVFNIGANINENERNHNLNFAYLNQTIYADFHEVKVSLTAQTISGLIQYALKTISSETIQGLMDKLTASTENLDLAGITQKVENMLKKVNVNDGNLNVELDLSEFGFDYVTPVVLGVDFNNNGVTRIYIEETKINNYGFSLDINFRSYVAPIIEVNEYQEITEALPILLGVVKLFDQTKFRLALDARIHDTADATANDVTIDAGVQFELDPNRNSETNKGYGYGELNIVDKKNYTHNIKADMKSVEEILFSYNDTLNGKFNIQTMKDLVDVIMDLIKNKDEDPHFQELFGALLDKLTNSPIMQALKGDFGLLLNYDIISNLEITNDHLSMDINFEVFGMEDMSMHLAITYVVTDIEDTGDCTLTGISISGLNIKGKEISADITLEEFDDSLESTRLDPSEEYLDFSDIKVLVELGLNTSKFNYYHFLINVKANTKISIFPTPLNFDFPIDVKIRNDHGDVQVAAEIEEFPTPLNGLANSGDYYYAHDRKESIYYHDGLIYLHRTEKVGKNVLNLTANHDYELVEIMTPKYFMDNALDIILRDVIGFGNSIMNLIDFSSTSSGDKVIHYEKILEDFQYNEEDKFFEFDINLNELTNMNIFTATTVKINHDDDSATNKPILTGVDASVGISIGGIIKVNATLSLDFLDDRSIELTETNKLHELEAFVNAHSQEVVDVYRNATIN